MDAPIGTVASNAKSDPFGGAKPRDEAAYQKKKREEEALVCAMGQTWGMSFDEDLL